MPPLRFRLVLRGARLWERAGRRMMPQFAGLTIIEAEKDMYGAIPSAAKPRRRLMLMPVRTGFFSMGGNLISFVELIFTTTAQRKGS